jgi:hypothetical protein
MLYKNNKNIDAKKLLKELENKKAYGFFNF